MADKTKQTISASPVKSFFVHMLTRDILLKDSILDLLDNCVDGVQRLNAAKKFKKKKPYEGYWAKISYSANEFIIEDNCGGIPWKYHDYAFRMGRPKYDIDKGIKTVGVYGIGMKRAIFKIGENCTIETCSKSKCYKVHLSPEWIKDDENWELEAVSINRKSILGTKIEITDLRKTIGKEFKSSTFSDILYSTIATHFAYIIGKGFRVFINEEEVIPKSLRLAFSDIKIMKNKIQPFIYKAKNAGVDIFLAVGFTRPIPSSEEVDESNENFKERHSSADAGWSIICNDRTVVYCDKTALSGWGISGVPQYHPQFIAISGIVIFESNKPGLLPTTTTKRGIDGNSELFLHVRDKMIEGMKIFTQYTNVWKTKELINESKKILRKTQLLGLEEVKQKVAKLPMQTTHGVYSGKQYKPKLPRPKVIKEKERISFRRSISEVKTVSNYLFDTFNRNPSQVGEKCFDIILEEAENE